MDVAPNLAAASVGEAANATPETLALSPDELLESVRAAMAALGSFYFQGELVLKSSREADETLLSMQLEGAGESKGDSQVRITVDTPNVGMEGELIFATRKWQGVSYTLDTGTGVWAIDDTDGSEDAFFEELVPEDMVAAKFETEVLNGLEVYRITGTVPDDPEIESVLLWVGADDLLVRQIQVQGKASSSDYEGLVPQEGGDLFQNVLFYLSRFNEPVRVTAPSVIATPTLEPCPQATPEPFMVESVISPTDQLSQVINVHIGNGSSVTITSEAGTFTGTEDAPFSVSVTLLPNTTNHLQVDAFVGTIRRGQCTYGGYSLTERLVIEQVQPAKQGKQYSEPPSMTVDPATRYVATIRTNMGDIVIELFPSDAPETVNNFVFLANEGFYDDVIFHRVIENFMIQGGDPTGTGGGGPGYTFGDEIDTSLFFDRPGILAMANAGPNTNGSQFFITVVPTPHLNGAHTIFGQVVEGQAVADAISKVPAGATNRPSQPVTIQGIEITKR